MATKSTIQPDPTPHLVAAVANTEQDSHTVVPDQRSAVAWALAASLGGISISIAPRDTLIRLVLPIAVMFIYVWWSYPRQSSLPASVKATGIAQLADSAYFLGFLWTLWALIDSFVLKRATSSETAFRVFGYALVTTAAGMAIRLYLLQFKYGATDQTADAQATIEQNLQLFSETIQSAARSVQSFDRNAESLGQRMSEISAKLQNLDQQFADTHQQTTGAIRDNITAVVEDIRAVLKAPAQEYGCAIRGFTANVEQQSKLLVDTLEKSSGNLNSVISNASECARNLIRTTGDKIASDHVDVSGQLRSQAARILEELSSLSTRMASIDIPTDGLKRVADSFNQLERAISAVTGVLRPDGQLRTNLIGFGDEVQLQTDTVAKALSSIATRLDSVEVPPRAAIDISNLTQSVKELQTGVEGLLQKTNDPRWGSTPQIASQAILKLAAAVTSLRETVSDTDDMIKRNLHASDGQRSHSFPRNLWPW